MNNSKNKTTRREFIAKSTLAAASVTLGNSVFATTDYRKVSGANEKIRMGFIGIGNRGSQLLKIFMRHPEVEIAALCDIYEPYLLRDRSLVDPRYIKDLGIRIPSLDEKLPGDVRRYNDYRKVLDDKNIDAVCIATPDHWHAIQTIQAIQSGKDVYVEKPLTATIREGRMMVEAQAASKQVVTCGLHRRGSPVYRRLAEIIPSGKIGKVTAASCSRIDNMFPSGIGKLKPEEPPKNFNWDMWLGPRAFRPYQYNIAPYKFRWWIDYSNQVGNWGIHYIDAIRWMMGETAPVAVGAIGGKYVVDDDRTIPDTLQVTFEFASGSILNFSQYEASSGNQFPFGEVELRGTKGTLYADESGFKITGTRPGQFQNWNKFIEDEVYSGKNEMLADGSSGDSTKFLIANFLECIKSRNKTFCSLEDGHRSTSFAHIANIALKLKARLEWDPVNERFTNNENANQFLHYEYRKPWKI